MGWVRKYTFADDANTTLRCICNALSYFAICCNTWIYAQSHFVRYSKSIDITPLTDFFEWWKIVQYDFFKVITALRHTALCVDDASTHLVFLWPKKKLLF